MGLELRAIDRANLPVACQRLTGDDYDRGLQIRLAGRNPHGEADFVQALAARLIPLTRRPAALLDAGCGTGRVGIELARRGFDVTGLDIDPQMLDVARRKAPELAWLLADLASCQLDRTFDLALLAGNVMIFVGRGNEAAVVTNVAGHLSPRGLLISGFQLQHDGLSVAEYDVLAREASLELVERWSTWYADAWTAASGYAVSVHRLVDTSSD